MLNKILRTYKELNRMIEDKQKIVVIGCINPMSAARAYLDALKENTDIVIEYFDTEGSFRGLKYNNILVDEWMNDVEAQTFTDEKPKLLQPTNPNFGKESWRKKK